MRTHNYVEGSHLSQTTWWASPPLSWAITEQVKKRRIVEWKCLRWLDLSDSKRARYVEDYKYRPYGSAPSFESRANIA